MKITRSYNLTIYPNYHKLEEIKYSSNRYMLYLNHFINNLFYRPDLKHFSTKNMGTLANKAQKAAIGIVKGERSLSKELDKKVSLPIAKFNMTPANISKSFNELENQKLFKHLLKYEIGNNGKLLLYKQEYMRQPAYYSLLTALPYNKILNNEELKNLNFVEI